MNDTTHETVSDEELMRRIGLGDQPSAMVAFDLLFLRHRRAVFGFLRRMTEEAGQAEDLTQECFLRLWRARSTYRPSTAAVRTYLLTIARRLALDAAKRPRVATEPLLSERDSGEESRLLDSATNRLLHATEEPEKALLAREMTSLVETAMAQLPLELREALLLRDGEGLTYEEIAAIVGCPISTVRSRLSAARTRLRVVARAYLNEEP